MNKKESTEITGYSHEECMRMNMRFLQSGKHSNSKNR